MKWVRIEAGSYELREGDQRVGDAMKNGSYWYWWLPGEQRASGPCTTLREAQVATEAAIASRRIPIR